LWGWPTPTPVNPSNLRDRRNGEVLVALAGPASNLVMASVAAIVVRILDAGDIAVPNLALAVLYTFVQLNVVLAIFNLLPIPPLDGSSLLYRVLSPQQAWQIRPVLQQYGFILLIVLIFALRGPFSALINNVTLFLLGI
jgi:Zn-dependent protease